MAIEYLGLSSINGPLIALEGVQDAFYDEIVDFVVNGKEHKMGRIVEVYKDKAIIQVFEGTENMSLNNTHTRLTGHPMEIGLSEEMLGRTFNGIGQPIDDMGPLISEDKRDVNGLPLSMIVSWYEQKAVADLLALLSLGVHNIYLGPTLPAFLSPNVLQYLTDTFHLRQISNAEDDIKTCLKQDIA